MENRYVTNKTVWVTGAGRGFGAEIARLLAKSRNFVIVSDRHAESLLPLWEAYPENIRMVPYENGINAAQEVLAEHTDHIDIVILGEELCEYDRQLEFSAEMASRVMQANYCSAVETLRLALPLLRRSNDNPQIVAISSLAALLPLSSAAAYGASKVALEYFLQSLKIELMSENIEISIMRTGFNESQLAFRNIFGATLAIQSREVAQEIVKAIGERKMVADFPRKVSVLLKLARFLPSLLARVLVPKLRKPEYL